MVPGIKEINFLVVGASALCVVAMAVLIPALYIQGWIDYNIYYTFVTSGYNNVATGFATIGVWDTCVTLKVTTSGTIFGVPFSRDTNTYQCLDTTESGYFDKDTVKVCRGFGIFVIVFLFLTAVFGILRVLVPIFRSHFAFGIIPIVSSGLSFVISAAVLILLKEKMLTGMSGAKCYNMCIGTAVLAGLASVLFGVGLALDKKLFGGGGAQAKINPTSAEEEKGDGKMKT